MELFTPIDPPARHSDSVLNAHGRWFTWADEIRGLLRDFRLHCPEMPSPSLVHLKGGKAYDYTYSLAPQVLGNEHISDLLHASAEAFYELDPGEEIMLFAGLIGRGIERAAFHAFFALIRAELAALDDSPFGALYAPLGEVGVEIKDFPLHSDLYPVDLLFNVFDEVPEDGSGASLFMSALDFVGALNELPSVPEQVRDDAEACLRERCEEDRFKEFFDLLYAPQHPWSRELQETAADRALRIRFSKGEGYLIHDRQWLHGRTMPVGGVSPSRLHRLAFNSAYSRETACLRAAR